MLGLALVYTLLANDDNSQFILSMSEREANERPQVIIENAFVKYEVLMEAF